MNCIVVPELVLASITALILGIGIFLAIISKKNPLYTKLFLAAAKVIFILGLLGLIFAVILRRPFDCRNLSGQIAGYALVLQFSGMILKSIVIK